MNCKPGDLAVIVKTASWTKQALGKIVTVVHVSEAYSGQYGPSWEYEPQILINGIPLAAIEDCCLRPIRPNDGEDEMIRIAGKPHDAHKSTPETA